MKAWAIPRLGNRLTAILAVAILYLVTGKLGFLMAIPPGNVTAVWPPSGIALAAVLLLGTRVWPGVWLGSFLVNTWFFLGITNPFSVAALAISASIALGSTLQALLGAFLIHRFVGSRSPFDRPQDTFRFVEIEVLSCVAAPTVGVTSLCVGGVSPWAAYAYTWWTWWLGDTSGAILVAPLFLAWSKQIDLRWQARRLPEALLLMVLLLAISLIVFGGQSLVGILYYPRAYLLLIPVLMWVAFRYGQRGVTLLLLVVSVTAIWATINGLGPFVAETRNESLLTLHGFVAILAVTGLVLAAAVTERKQAAERFRLVVESAPNAMVMAGPQGQIVLLNSQAERLFGYRREELIGNSIEMLVPERFRSEHPAYRMGFCAQPHARPMGAGRDLYAVRKDGSEFPVEIGLNPIETGEGISVLSAIVDITERKRAESQVRTALEEKELLLQEIHHRVKNNLQIISSLLSIQSRRIEDKQALRTFKDSQNRIESIALIHEILCHSKDFSQIDFARYLRELSHHLLASYRKNKREIQLEVNVDDIWLSVEKAVPLGLLITEIVSNSLIHAFPSAKKGKVSVELRPAETNQLVLSISDNGVGFPETVDFHSPRSIGLQLVSRLAEQLHGTIEFHPNGGTKFKIVFRQ